MGTLYPLPVLYMCNITTLNNNGLIIGNYYSNGFQSAVREPENGVIAVVARLDVSSNRCMFMANIPNVKVVYSQVDHFNTESLDVVLNGIYTTSGNLDMPGSIVLADPFPDRNSASLAFSAMLTGYPITYRLTNCSTPSAPMEAMVGDIVNVDVTFPQGYGIVNPSSDVYVTNNGVVVPSSYSNGRLTFTMPDPS